MSAKKIIPQILEYVKPAGYSSLTQLIQEGIEDGSIQTEYAKELSELLPLLTNFWLIPSVYPATPEELISKFAFIKYLLDSMNLPIIDDEIFGMAQNYFERLNVGE